MSLLTDNEENRLQDDISKDNFIYDCLVNKSISIIEQNSNDIYDLFESIPYNDDNILYNAKVFF